MVAITAFTGTCWATRFITPNELEPIPSSIDPAARRLGTETPGPPWMMETSSPRFWNSPVASA